MGASKALTRYLLKKEIKLKKRERSRRKDYLVWTPSPGDTLIGRLIERGRGKTKYGDREFIKVDTSKDIYLIYLNHILMRELDAEGAETGKDIAVKFTGKISKNSKVYNDYLLSALPLNVKIRSPLLRLAMFVLDLLI